MDALQYMFNSRWTGLRLLCWNVVHEQGESCEVAETCPLLRGDVRVLALGVDGQTRDESEYCQGSKQAPARRSCFEFHLLALQVGRAQATDPAASKAANRPVARLGASNGAGTQPVHL